VSVPADDGFRALEYPSGRAAAFCRLEHVVPWAMREPHWQVGEAAELANAPERCSHCSGELGDRYLVLLRHRGEHRIADGFCSIDHLREWAGAGGRWKA